MGNYVFAILAFILLLPLFFLLPMKLSKKGKWVIPSIAFAASVAGIYISELLTLWHSIVFMLLLLLLAAIFLQRMQLFSSAPTNLHTQHAQTHEHEAIEEPSSMDDSYVLHKSNRVYEELSDDLTEKR